MAVFTSVITNDQGRSLLYRHRFGHLEALEESQAETQVMPRSFQSKMMRIGQSFFLESPGLGYRLGARNVSLRRDLTSAILAVTSLG